MNKLPAILALIILGATSAPAQLGSFGDYPIEINADNTRIETGVAVAEGNVFISYGTIVIYCDFAQYSPDTRDVLVEGNVRLYRDGQLFTGDRALYNLETKRLTAADFKGSFHPFSFAGDSFSSLGGNAYLVKDGIFTTSETSKLDYHIKARTVRIYPNDRVVFSNATVYIGRTPVFWFPYVYQSLNKEQGFSLAPGYTSDWGTFLLTTYTFPVGENWHASLRFDLRSERGVAAGLETYWATGESGRDWGRFRFYGLNDENPGMNDTGLEREEIDPGRYRISFQAKQYLTDDIYATVDINKLSDARFLEDFAQGEFRRNPNPDNAITLTYWNEDFTVTLIGRENINDDNFDGTERLPDLALDVKRLPLFGSKVFYQGESSVAFLRRNFADLSQFQDYETFRADTFHQLVLPLYAKNISIVPRVGVRGTYYRNTGTYFDRTVTESVDQLIFDEATGLTELAQQQVTTTERLLRGGGSVFRPVVNAGFELSTKWSKAYEQVQSRALGLDGLRHIIQPWLNFSYTYSGEDPDNILQFDRLTRSTQLPPVDYPEFNTIDTISSNTTVRLGLRNRWQTRRDNQTFNWLELNTFFDAYIDRPQYAILDDTETGDFSNVHNRLRFSPVPWAQLTVDSQLPILDSGFTELNSTIGVMVTRDVTVSIGHRYINGNPFFLDSNLLNFGAYVRMGDNWAFSFRESYEFEDSTLEAQRYELHRDLSSWVASLGFTVRDNRGDENYGVLLTFTLKDLPNLRVPLAIDPDIAGGGDERND